MLQNVNANSDSLGATAAWKSRRSESAIETPSVQNSQPTRRRFVWDTASTTLKKSFHLIWKMTMELIEFKYLLVYLEECC